MRNLQFTFQLKDTGVDRISSRIAGYLQYPKARELVSLDLRRLRVCVILIDHTEPGK